MTENVIEVLVPGFLTTVQDLGRRRFAHLGVSPGGAADPVALRLANRLVGNDDSAAAFEMTMNGANVRFLAEAWVALTGANCFPRLNGNPISMWTTFRVRKGETLSIGAAENGLRAYLSVDGGISAPVILGSRSTFVSGPWGGPFGRELKSGDRLSRGTQVQFGPQLRRTRAVIRDLYTCLHELRATRGPQWDWFSHEAQSHIFSNEFSLTTKVDRKGLRFEGQGLSLAAPREMITEGVSAGAVQVPMDGHPILLYCEQQTTGGYPKIANVIHADLFKVGQLKPGDRIRFREVDFEAAQRANRDFERLFQSTELPI